MFGVAEPPAPSLNARIQIGRLPQSPYRRLTAVRGAVVHDPKDTAGRPIAYVWGGRAPRAVAERSDSDRKTSAVAVSPPDRGERSRCPRPKRHGWPTDSLCLGWPSPPRRR